MDYYLILAQTVFYAVFSLAILIFTIALGIVAYYLIIISRHLRKIAENLDGTSEEIKEYLHELLGSISKLPLISLLFKHKPWPREEADAPEDRRKQSRSVKRQRSES